MLTRKASSLVIIAIVSIFVGLLLRSPYIVLISVPVISYVIFSFLLYSKNVHTNLVVKYSLSRDSIYEGETAEVSLEIQNLGEKLEFVEITDVLPRELVVRSGSVHRILELATNETFSFTYTVAPKVYGFHYIGPAIVVAKDNQFMTSQTRIFSESTNILLKVFPKIQYVPKIAIRPKRTRNWPGEIVARKPGPGMEFYSLREYQHGDPVKSINWKSSSRSSEEDRLFTNQFMVELGGDTIIALDVRTSSALGEPPDSTDTYSTRAAAIVAHRLLRDRNRVGMIILGTRLDKVPPGFGKRQFDRILTALSQVKPDTTWEIGNLGGYLSIFFSTMVQIVIVSPLMDDNSFHAVVDIAARGYQVLVISPSPIEIEKRLYSKYRPDDEFNRLAERLLKVKRENRLNVLRRSAVVVDWNVDAPLSEALREATYLWNRQKVSTSPR